MGLNRWYVVMIVLTFLFIAAAIYIPLANYDALPDRYPTHFNLAGEPDSWDSKSISTLLMGPGIVAATTLIMLPVTLWIAYVRDPRKIINGPKEKVKNMPLERAELIRKITVFHLLLIMLLISVMMLVISVESVLIAMGKQAAMGPAILITTIFLLADSVYMTVKLLGLVYK